MGKRYRKPPLEQFVCEFRFEPGSPWDLTIPGLIYERLQGDFPKRKQEARYESRLKKAKQGLEHEVTKSEQMKLLNESESALVQIGQNLIAVVHLRPYPGWEDFLPMINRGLEVYKEVARPAGINRIGLRCVNLVKIPDSKVELEQYFDFYPHLGSDFPMKSARSCLEWNLGSMKGVTFCVYRFRLRFPRIRRRRPIYCSIWIISWGFRVPLASKTWMNG